MKIKLWRKNESNEIAKLTRNLNDEKLPFAGGLHDITAAFPLRAITDRFAGGSGAETKLWISISTHSTETDLQIIMFADGKQRFRDNFNFNLFFFSEKKNVKLF